MFTKIDDRFFAAPQIALDDVARAKEAGIALIVNNRPDGEDPSAPQSAAIAAAAEAAGLGYVYIPVTHSGFSLPQLDALTAAMANANGPILGYCRSGTRSTLLWALASAKMGKTPADIAAKAAAGGYDVSPVRPAMDSFFSASADQG